MNHRPLLPARFALGLAIWVSLLPGSGRAQEEEPTATGSLTVVSRPPNVAVEISGDRSIVGRTPFTLERGLAGRFRVRSIEPGYETWRRNIVLDGTSADTLWVTLQPKTALKAGMRSLAVPGWGQAYSGRGTAGWIYLGAAAVAGGALLWTHLEYEDRVEAYNQATTNAARRIAAERAEEAYEDRRLALGVIAAVWAVNAADAVVFFPRLKPPPAPSVGIELRPTQEPALALSLVVRF